MTIINMWGPAIIVCLTVILSLFHQNKRIDDLKSQVDTRFSDLYRYLDGKFKAIEDRLEKLENQKVIK